MTTKFTVASEVDNSYLLQPPRPDIDWVSFWATFETQVTREIGKAHDVCWDEKSFSIEEIRSVKWRQDACTILNSCAKLLGKAGVRGLVSRIDSSIPIEWISYVYDVLSKWWHHFPPRAVNGVDDEVLVIDCSFPMVCRAVVVLDYVWYPTSSGYAPVGHGSSFLGGLLKRYPGNRIWAPFDFTGEIYKSAVSAGVKNLCSTSAALFDSENCMSYLLHEMKPNDVIVVRKTMVTPILSTYLKEKARFQCPAVIEETEFHPAKEFAFNAMAQLVHGTVIFPPFEYLMDIPFVTVCTPEPSVVGNFLEMSEVTMVPLQEIQADILSTDIVLQPAVGFVKCGKFGKAKAQLVGVGKRIPGTVSERHRAIQLREKFKARKKNVRRLVIDMMNIEEDSKTVITARPLFFSPLPSNVVTFSDLNASVAALAICEKYPGLGMDVVKIISRKIAQENVFRSHTFMFSEMRCSVCDCSPYNCKCPSSYWMPVCNNVVLRCLLGHIRVSDRPTLCTHIMQDGRGCGANMEVIGMTIDAPTPVIDAAMAYGPILPGDKLHYDWRFKRTIDMSDIEIPARISNEVMGAVSSLENQIVLDCLTLSELPGVVGRRPWVPSRIDCPAYCYLDADSRYDEDGFFKSDFDENDNPIWEHYDAEGAVHRLADFDKVRSWEVTDTIIQQNVNNPLMRMIRAQDKGMRRNTTFLRMRDIYRKDLSPELYDAQDVLEGHDELGELVIDMHGDNG